MLSLGSPGHSAGGSGLAQKERVITEAIASASRSSHAPAGHPHDRAARETPIRTAWDQRFLFWVGQNGGPGTPAAWSGGWARGEPSSAAVTDEAAREQVLGTGIKELLLGTRLSYELKEGNKRLSSNRDGLQKLKRGGEWGAFWEHERPQQSSSARQSQGHSAHSDHRGCQTRGRCSWCYF